MRCHNIVLALLLAAAVGLGCATAAKGADIKLLTHAADPYGIPRPAPNQENVPLRTSFFIELALTDPAADDLVLPESVSLDVSANGVPARTLLRAGKDFAPGCTGKFIPGKRDKVGPVLSLYVDGTEPLRAATRYTLRLSAKSKAGGTLPEKAGTWQFTTEAAPTTHQLRFALPADTPVVRWHGGFFTGTCNVTFCTSAAYRLPTFELMDQVRKTSPRAWSLQRDFWMTGMEHKPSFFGGHLPNIVRERETRHVLSIAEASLPAREAGADQRASVLQVEDFFGHEQYGIPSNRPLSADYHADDEVLIADGTSDARAKVISVDDQKRTVTVTRIEPPKGGWKLAYSGKLPEKENPNAPGLFPPGGCYLMKFCPAGTPSYYWGRLDYEWDIQVKRFKRRVLPNFADAPGDLSLNGRDWTTAKDYAELHEVARAITSHLIERYGDATLTFPWSIFNEPDLGALFWHSDWTELQKFYDYAVDGVLRAFEDRGYDSNKVFIGGLELAGIFGTNLRVREFLSHCSPRETKVKGALAKNAAFADPRLDGKRSRRVETLCKANDGRGAPCDFVSIHAYNRSQMMADKLAKTKEIALELDPEFYARLWVNSHESCPGWTNPPDPAYNDSYLGNGYYPTWCADVVRRQLQQAAKDPRYAFGESILTQWPWPNANFGGGNDYVRAISADDDGDGKPDRTVTVAMPILHFLGLLCQMGPEYRVLPEQKIGSHTVGGFISPMGKVHRVLLYSHNMADTESRSQADFEITLELTGFAPGPRHLREYRFDKDHNSYFRLGRTLREQPKPPRAYPAGVVREVEDRSQLHVTDIGWPTAGTDGRLTLTVRLAANGANYLVVE